MAEEEANVSTPGIAWNAMSEGWGKMEALLGGTTAMRAAGELYLPQYEGESDRRYETRLNMSTLLNRTKATLNYLAGCVFDKPLSLGDDVPEQIKTLCEDIDGAGNHIHVFAYALFKDGMAKGICHVLVDHTVAQPRADGNPRTLEDDARDGVRPYWTHIRPENLIFAAGTADGGKFKLTEVRIVEEIVEQQGFGEVCVKQVRVLKPGIWELWRELPPDVVVKAAPGVSPTGARVKARAKSGKKLEWRIWKHGTTTIDFIPLVTFYGSKTGFMQSDLPLGDLADLNIAHWQSSSDQRNILSAARFPMLAVSGETGVDQDGNPLKVGPWNFLATADSQGKFYYVEHSGAAIGAGRQDLQDLETQMAAYGAQFTQKRPDNEGSMARILDSAESVSELQAMALNFKDALELALEYTAKWLKLESGGQVVLDSDVAGIGLDAASIQALQEARRAREISRSTYLLELKRRDILSDDYDPAKDLEQLDKENDVGLGDAGDDEDDPEDDS